MKLKKTIRNPWGTLYHIPTHIGGDKGFNKTLCGWVDDKDQIFDAEEYPPNCPMCLEALQFCKELELPLKKKE